MNLAGSNERLGRIFTSKYFYGALFAAACIISLLEIEVFGAVMFAVIICAALCLCDDIMATTAPFLLMCVFLCRCYDSYNTFIKFAPLAIPVAAIFIWHFIRFRKKIIIGESFWGVVAVAVAVTLGGIGKIPVEDYFSGTSLYYVGFLGLGMIVSYLLLRPKIETKSYDIKEKFTSAMYLAGLLACVVVIGIVIKGSVEIIQSEKIVNKLDYIRAHIAGMLSRANYCTFIMFAMPFVFYRSLKNKWHVLSALLMLGTIFLTASRAGLLFGTLEFLILIVYACIYDRKWTPLYIGCVALPVAVLLCSTDIVELLFYRFRNGFISENDARLQLVFRSIEDFKSNIIFGQGLGYRGNTDIYNPKTGAMTWYHMMIPQIIGSMGIVGILGYGYQIFTRVKLVLCKFSAWKWAVSLSYLGILMMSQVNPGEFCPIPYELMTVMLFMFMEYDKEQTERLA